MSSRHTLHQKKFGGTQKIVKLKKTSKNSCFALNKLKLAICVQSNCANYHLQTTKIQLMHTGLTVYLNIGSKISKSNREKFGTLCRSSRHTSVPRHTGWETLIYTLIKWPQTTFKKQKLLKYNIKYFILKKKKSCSVCRCNRTWNIFDPKFVFHLKKGKWRNTNPGGNSQNFSRKFVRFFLTLKCFYRVVSYRK